MPNTAEQMIEPEAPIATFDLDLQMAFRPIVDVEDRTILAHDALERAPNGRGEAWVRARVDDTNRAAFDHARRDAAITAAARAGMAEPVAIPFLPDATDDPADPVDQTLWMADKHDLTAEQILMVLSEAEHAIDLGHLKAVCRLCRRAGLSVVMDDFGTGPSALARLAELRPGLVRLDRTMVRKIDVDPRRRAIVAGMMAICLDLGIDLIAKGVEDMDAQLLQMYERKKGLRGIRIAAVRREACGACFHQMPAQTLNEVRIGNRVIYCESCGTIMVWVEQ